MTNNAPPPAAAPAPPHPISTPGWPTSPPPPDPRSRSPYGSGPPRLPPKRPARHHPNLDRPLASALIVSVVFAIATPDSPLRSLGWALALSVLVGALVAAAARRPAAIWLGVAGAAFLPWLAVRMSPWLISINLLAALGLLLAALSLPPAGSLRIPVAHHLARITRAIGGLLFGPHHFAHETRGAATGTRTTAARRLLPSMLVGIAALAVGLTILASGDALLASFLDLGEFGDNAAGRIVAGLIGIAAFAVMIGAVHVPGSSDPAPRLRTASALPTLFGIGGLSIAIGAYAATQIGAAMLGADFVRSRTGLTYAEYARSGFFQMVIIALLAVGAIGVARSAIGAAPEAAGRIRIGAAVLTIGVVATVLSAVVKLGVYTDTFGLTLLRLYTVVFACWIGLVAVLAFVALIDRRAEWFAPLLLASMLFGAFGMNIANPERIVVNHNLDRAEVTGKLDVDYLSGLSLDAAPVVFDRLETIDAIYDDRSRSSAGTFDAQELIRETWCRKLDEASDPAGFFATNVARVQAIDASDEACP